jgi:hypothetical protein
MNTTEHTEGTTDPGTPAQESSWPAGAPDPSVERLVDIYTDALVAALAPVGGGFRYTYCTEHKLFEGMARATIDGSTQTFHVSCYDPIECLATMILQVSGRDAQS